VKKKIDFFLFVSLGGPRGQAEGKLSRACDPEGTNPQVLGGRLGAVDEMSGSVMMVAGFEFTRMTR
jgi:hypothetical protein